MALRLKLCKECGVEKAPEDFHLHSSGAFGVRAICKECRSIDSAARRRADPLAKVKDKIRYEKYKVAHGINSRKWKAKAGRRYLDQQKKYREINKAQIAERMRLWHIKNRERNLARKARWRSANITSVRAYNTSYDKMNMDRGAAKQARRRAQILRATPKWNNEFYMREAYRLAALRTKMLGFEWNVDHVVPLKSKIVCGLHVHNNLQVIPFLENMTKGNRVWPDMPEQVWR